MTWALAKVTKFLAICMSLRNTLKILKKVSISEDDKAITERQKRIQLEHCSGILMFWTIFGVSVVCEQYFEFLFRWLPLYYYAKTFFILFMAFPRLKFTEYVFYKFLVPSVEFVHDNVGNISAMPPGDVLMLLIFQGVFVCFPMINHPDAAKVSYIPSVTETLIVDSDSVGSDDGMDLDDILAEEGAEGKEIDLDEIFNDNNADEGYLADLSVKLDFDDSNASIHDGHDTNRMVSAKERVTAVKEVKEDDYSLSFSFDDVDKDADDGFTLSLPSISGYDSNDEDGDKSEDDCAVHTNINEAVYESPSRVLRSFRKLLTGDSNTRLSETIFNLDLHSPPPNTQYRNRRKSAMHSPSTTAPRVNTRSARTTVNQTRSSEGGTRPVGKSSIFNLRRNISLQPTSSVKPLPNLESSTECYSPLHGSRARTEASALNKENIIHGVGEEVGDSLDSLLNTSSDKKTHVTLRRRGKKTVSDEDVISTRIKSTSSRSEAKGRTGGVGGDKQGGTAYDHHPSTSTQGYRTTAGGGEVPELRRRRVSESIVYKGAEEEASGKKAQAKTDCDRRKEKKGCK